MRNIFSIRTRGGFTLVEMVVVLAILVALSTIAVTSLEGVQDQGRYDATQQSMQNIEDAVIGPANQHTADGVPLVTGFVADVGRLPKAATVVVNGVTQLQPLELWQNPNNLDAFGLKNAISTNISNVTSTLDGNAGAETAATLADNEVYVPCGWRGPYLRLGVGRSTINDGWGNPLDLLKYDRTTVSAGIDEISIIRSLGADNVYNNSATNNYNEDLYINFNTNVFTGTSSAPDYPAVAASDRYHAATVAAPLSVTVSPPAGGSFNTTTTVLSVRYFGPDPTTGKIRAISVAKTLADKTTPVTFLFVDTNIGIGPRVLRAYQSDGTKSTIKQITLVGAGSSHQISFQ